METRDSCRLHQQGAIRFTELLRSIPLTTNQPITKKVLIQQLRELEEYGLIEHKIFPEVPPRVEYNLTDYGKSTRAVIEEMIKWGESFGENSQQI
ncbi:winged helix-turn-helix transcriptional regulator [Paenibacillus elgii]